MRTRKTPYKSKTGRHLLTSSLAVVATAFALPYTPLGAKFQFVPPPAAFYPALAGLIIAYLLLAEFAKKWFNKRYAYLLEQEYVTKKAKATNSTTNRLGFLDKE